MISLAATCFFKWVEGEFLGDTFLLKERLGRGTYGVVGAAVRLKDNQEIKKGEMVALKVPFDQELGADFLKQEPEIIQRFDHVNIVKVYDYHIISGYFVTEMELVEGNSLSDILDNHTFIVNEKLSTAFGWIQQCAAALMSMGDFAHGDVKPQNILIRNDGIVKLVDFGTSRRMEDALVFTSGKGTEQYMAPEVALDNKRVSIKSDMYSVGVVFYEIVTGELPFHSNLERLQGKRLTKPREINSSIPVPLENLILRCLERDPDLRYPSWQSFIEELNLVQIDLELVADSSLPESKVAKFQPTPSSPLYYLDQAKKAMIENNYTEALKHVEEAVSISEGHPNYLRMMGAICLRIGYFDKAKGAYSKLLEKYESGYPVEPDELGYVLSKLSDIHIELKEFEEAVTCLNQYCEVSNKSVPCRFKLAVAYGLNGQYGKAIDLLEGLKLDRPDSTLIFNKLGWAYSLKGDFRQAISYYNQTLVIDPYDMFSLFELGKYYRILGDRRRSKKYFKKIRSFDRSGEYIEKVNELYE